jgi:hypothetical protein
MSGHVPAIMLEEDVRMNGLCGYFVQKVSEYRYYGVCVYLCSSNAVFAFSAEGAPELSGVLLAFSWLLVMMKCVFFLRGYPRIPPVLNNFIVNTSNNWSW